MKYLVTGGAGFIGSNLCRRLLDDGHSVACLDDLSTGNHRNIKELEENPNFEFFKHDLTITSTYANSPQDLTDSLDIISSGKIQVHKMITNRLPLKEIQKGFDLVSSGENSLKVIIEPHS